MHFRIEVCSFDGEQMVLVMFTCGLGPPSLLSAFFPLNSFSFTVGLFMLFLLFFIFRLEKLLMDQMMAWSGLFLMELNMIMVSIVVLLLPSLLYVNFVYTLNALHLIYVNGHIFVIQYLMLILEMVNPFGSCHIIDQVSLFALSIFWCLKF